MFLTKALFTGKSYYAARSHQAGYYFFGDAWSRLTNKWDLQLIPLRGTRYFMQSGGYYQR